MPRRVDNNQSEIVAALRGVGASVLSLHYVGQGVPDLLAYWRGAYHLIEVKTATGRLTPVQVRWRETWKGPIHTVRTVDEALAAIGAVEALEA